MPVLTIFPTNKVTLCSKSWTKKRNGLLTKNWVEVEGKEGVSFLRTGHQNHLDLQQLQHKSLLRPLCLTVSERSCFRKRKRKHTDASLIKYKLLLSHCQDLSKLLFGCRATPWQKTFSLFPRGCFHLKAAIVRSCSRRQVAGPGWLVVPPLVHWSGSLCSSSSPPTFHPREMAALVRPFLAVLLLLGAVLAAQVNVPYSTDLWVVVL